MSESIVKAAGEVEIRLVSDRRWQQQASLCEDAVEQIWQDKLAQSNGNLFNGKLFHFCNMIRQIDKTILNGHFIEYRHFIAKREKPELDLNITPVGVGGITVFCDNGTKYIIVARRGTNYTKHDGMWELAPAGGIDDSCLQGDSIDYKGLLREEFQEETGLCTCLLNEINTLCLVYDPVINLYNLSCEINLGDLKNDLLKKSLSSTDEYAEFRIFTLPEAQDFFHKNNSVSTSTCLIDYYCRHFQ